MAEDPEHWRDAAYQWKAKACKLEAENACLRAWNEDLKSFAQRIFLAGFAMGAIMMLLCSFGYFQSWVTCGEEASEWIKELRESQR